MSDCKDYDMREDSVTAYRLLHGKRFSGPLTPEQRERYYIARRKLKDNLRPHFAACDDMRRLTAEVYKIIINV